MEAYPAAGYIQPGQTKPVIIKLTTFDVPCEMQLNVPCKFLDETQNALHQTSLMAYYQRNRKSTEMFEFPERSEGPLVSQKASLIPQTQRCHC